MTGTIIEPAVNAISNNTNATAEFHMFHGFTPAFFSTLGIYVAGILLIFSFGYWISLLKAQPTKLTINYWYDKVGTVFPGYSSQFTNTYVTGFTRNNLLIIFASLIVITLVTLLVTPFSVNFKDVSEIRPFELIIVVIIITAASMIIFARSRLFSIIMASAVGYAVAIFFIFFGAPDLALTQFVVESISTALFLLCFYHLPNLNRHNESTSFKWLNVLIAIGAGTVVTVLGLITYGNRHFGSIGEFYKAHVYDLAHGTNMVNVILVDFRGTDTLFESSVLGIAGLGVYTMIKLRYKNKPNDEGGTHIEKTEK